MYSVASSSRHRPTKLQLLVVEETWNAGGSKTSSDDVSAMLLARKDAVENVNTKNDKAIMTALPGEERVGLCSGFLARARPGQVLYGHLTESVMRMPADKKTTVIMAGLGTGFAPFRAFCEQRFAEKKLGFNVGPMQLYFGGRHRSTEHYYESEMEVYEVCHTFYTDHTCQTFFRRCTTQPASKQFGVAWHRSEEP